MIYAHKAIIHYKGKRKISNVPICRTAPDEFSGCRMVTERQLQEDGAKGAADAVERDICHRRRKHQLRHEVEGDEEGNIQGGWMERREGVSRQSDHQSPVERDF